MLLLGFMLAGREVVAMNLVDVDMRSTRRQVVRRNIGTAVAVWVGTVALIGLVFWLFFGVLLGPYW